MPCCEDNDCDYGKMCDGVNCIECGGNGEQPCSDGCDSGKKLTGDICKNYVASCEAKELQSSKDYCYWGYATGSGDKSYCDLIVDPSIRNSCLGV